jgi:hypothetical protein
LPSLGFSEVSAIAASALGSMPGARAGLAIARIEVGR